ncbi:MAG: hypothetical protein KC457_27625, partial [Myxococcales bacterium]|nr:hypothetical protein [Myxococcales bacterium]
QDGSVGCWSLFNNSGELGDGTQLGAGVGEIVEVTTLEGPLDDVVQIEAGWDFSCTLRGDGSVWCWGGNSYGNLGQGQLGSELPRLTRATAVPDLTGVSRLSAKNASVCVVLDEGSVRCWGDINYLFANAGAATPTPMAVEFGAAAVDVDSAGFTTCILDVDGHVRCLGIYPGNYVPGADPWSGDPVLTGRDGQRGSEAEWDSAQAHASAGCPSNSIFSLRRRFFSRPAIPTVPSGY